MILPSSHKISLGAVARFCFLDTPADLAPEEFGQHHEHTHGPQAVAQQGFREYAARHVHNHVTRRIAGDSLEVGGITMTVREPRADGTGFIHEPDHVVVQHDEHAVLDVDRARSVLGRLVAVGDGIAQGGKVVVVGPAAEIDAVAASEPVSHHLSWELDRSSASALGFATASFTANALAELWTEDVLGLAATIRTSVGNGVDAWAVRELSMIPLHVDPRDAQEIAELKAAYCRYVDTKSWHLLPRLFAPNATFNGFAFDTCNVQAFIDNVAAYLADVQTVHQIFAPEMRALSPDRIRVSWVMQDLLRWAPGSREYRGMEHPDLAGINGYGHYQDEYVRTGDGWRLNHTCLTRLYVEPILRADLDSPPSVRALTPGWLDPAETAQRADSHEAAPPAAP